MVLGWRDFFKTKVLQRRHEFVSADARNFNPDSRTYEMLDSAKATPALNISSPDRVLSLGQAHPLRSSPMTPEPDYKEDSYFNRKTSTSVRIHDSNSPQTPAAAYTFPSPSPNSPGARSPQEWDRRPTHAISIYGPGDTISKEYT